MFWWLSGVSQGMACMEVRVFCFFLAFVKILTFINLKKIVPYHKLTAIFCYALAFRFTGWLTEAFDLYLRLSRRTPVIP